MSPDDPSAFHAWMLAIPSAITAVSAWYTNRSSKKRSQVVKEVAQTTGDATVAEIAKIGDRVERLEQIVHQTNQKHTESIEKIHAMLQTPEAPVRTSPLNGGTRNGNGKTLR